ncbi:MAG: ribonuclease PH [Victivallales bacterium]|nr:ribonuclease PH [Victivallales bacterium]MCF7888528.1 ribonuclease PH [Victivallales bacterium]
MRKDNRENNELRNINMITGYLMHPAGSVLIEFGKTRVICSVTVADEVPHWMRAQNIKGGWLTAEYQLLPSSTGDRVRRERKGVSGRTQEIQRLIGRSLRAACDLEKIPGKTIYIDCDVIDADGGTRCASISGAMTALRIAAKKLLKEGKIKENPIITDVAAVSVGILDNEAVLDLCYEEDSNAEVDMNVIMTAENEFVEVQGTAEARTFSRKQMDKMLDLAVKGNKEILEIQKKEII